MADMPDLSHLTEEERKIIENVMMRQKQEEERENEIMRCVSGDTFYHGGRHDSPEEASREADRSSSSTYSITKHFTNVPK